METTTIRQLASATGKEVRLQGWVNNIRSSGKIVFLELRDGSGFCQCVATKTGVRESIWNDLQKLTLESSVEVSGTVTEHPKKPGVFELQITGVSIVNISPEYPIGKKEHGPDFLLENRHLWLRSKRQWAIQRVRHTIINATYEFFDRAGFTKIDSPILTPSSCEDTTQLFEVEYFDLGKAYLSQSGQLYLEVAIASLGKVFDFGPVFRAEKSKTRRHLTEFWMMDAEMAFYDQEKNMQLQEQLISFLAEKVIERNTSDLAILERDITKLEKIKAPFHRVTYDEAIKKLQSLGSDIKYGEDLGNDDETLIMKDLDKPLFVERWPANIKAFYMKRDGDKALCADVLAPEGFGEIIGGSQREDSYDELLKRITEHKLEVKAFEWYLDLRKYGSVPHAGFGYGLERITAWFTGSEHVRETIPFPRTIYRIYP